MMCPVWVMASYTGYIQLKYKVDVTLSKYTFTEAKRL